jgi:pimeloyl-ACP methyl ester carboxylesterase
VTPVRRLEATPIAEVTVPKIIDHLTAVIDELPAPKIIIGHSAGGAFTQILLDHGKGVAGVALNSAPTEGPGSYRCLR